LILGFGIGTNTAVFSLIDAVVLKPLPFPHSERLVELFMPLRNDEDMPFDYPDYEDIRVPQHSFQPKKTGIRYSHRPRSANTEHPESSNATY